MAEAENSAIEARNERLALSAYSRENSRRDDVVKATSTQHQLGESGTLFVVSQKLDHVPEQPRHGYAVGLLGDRLLVANIADRSVSYATIAPEWNIGDKQDELALLIGDIFATGCRVARAGLNDPTPLEQSDIEQRLHMIGTPGALKRVPSLGAALARIASIFKRQESPPPATHQLPLNAAEVAALAFLGTYGAGLGDISIRAEACEDGRQQYVLEQVIRDVKDADGEITGDRVVIDPDGSVVDPDMNPSLRARATPELYIGCVRQAFEAKYDLEHGDNYKRMHAIADRLRADDVFEQHDNICRLSPSGTIAPSICFSIGGCASVTIGTCYITFNTPDGKASQEYDLRELTNGGQLGPQGDDYSMLVAIWEGLRESASQRRAAGSPDRQSGLNGANPVDSEVER